MTVAALLSELQRHGISVEVDEGALVLKGRRSLLTPALRERIASQKDALVATLTGSESADQWQRVYAEVGAWPADIQTLTFAYSQILIGLGRDAADAEVEAIRVMRQVVAAPVVSVALRNVLGVNEPVFSGISRETVNRPGPATREQDMVVAAALLRRHPVARRPQ